MAQLNNNKTQQITSKDEEDQKFRERGEQGDRRSSLEKLLPVKDGVCYRDFMEISER